MYNLEKTKKYRKGKYHAAAEDRAYRLGTKESEELADKYTKKFDTSGQTVEQQMGIKKEKSMDSTILKSVANLLEKCNSHVFESGKEQKHQPPKEGDHVFGNTEPNPEDKEMVKYNVEQWGKERGQGDAENLFFNMEGKKIALTRNGKTVKNKKSKKTKKSILSFVENVLSKARDVGGLQTRSGGADVWGGEDSGPKPLITGTTTKKDPYLEGRTDEEIRAYRQSLKNQRPKGLLTRLGITKSIDEMTAMKAIESSELFDNSYERTMKSWDGVVPELTIRKSVDLPGGEKATLVKDDKFAALKTPEKKVAVMVDEAKRRGFSTTHPVDDYVAAKKREEKTKTEKSINEYIENFLKKG